MQERYLGRIEPGMDVADIAGEKIGSIARIYRHALEPAFSGEGTPSGGVTAARHDEILEVKTGPLGLGKHLYVPFGAIEDVTSGCVFVKLAKEDVEHQGWNERPAYLSELT
jgi:hypothetical protein